MAEPRPETIRRAQRGDREALVEIVDGQQRYVYSIAMSLMRDPDDAADLTQDSFIRLMRSIHSYRGETKFTTWLYRLVVNLGLDRLRRRRGAQVSLDAQPARDVEDQSPWKSAPTVVERAEEAEAVQAAVAELPEGQRLALTLHYFEDLRYEDVADIMGLPLNTVKSHIRRGKQRLAELLEPILSVGPSKEPA